MLVKCRRDGVSVPGVLGLDFEGGWLALEWVGGCTVRRALDWWCKSLGRGIEDVEDGERESGVLDLMRRIGRAVGGLHANGVVHGDLTTSNIMLRPHDYAPATEAISSQLQPRSLPISTLRGEIVLIDFGLAAQNIQEEDKAVDLYVLERAFGSTHPETEEAFKYVLEAYGESFKGAKIVLKRLEDVRMRGRKKSMLG